MAGGGPTCCFKIWCTQGARVNMQVIGAQALAEVLSLLLRISI